MNHLLYETQIIGKLWKQGTYKLADKIKYRRTKGVLLHTE